MLNRPDVLADDTWDEDKVCRVSELETKWQGDSFPTSFKSSHKVSSHCDGLRGILQTALTH